MRKYSLIVLSLMTTTSPLLAQEAATATTPAPATEGVIAPHDGFAAPNGRLGAGLSISRETGLRAYGEFGFYTTGQTVFDVIDITLTSVNLVVGGGYKLSRELELEMMLPFAYGTVSVESNDPDVDVTGDDSDSGWAIGNLHFGVSYVRAEGPLRMKLGGAVQWGPWTIDPADDFAGAMSLAAQTNALHDVGLWTYETVSLVTPSRVEYGDDVVATGDASLGLHVPTDGRDVEMTVQLDPGVGYYASETALVGVRLPIVFIPTDSGDNLQVAAEPYVRFGIGPGFLNARFTVNLDEPLGFAFDEGKIWAIHLGGGGTF
jgi:hypothetical protein